MHKLYFQKINYKNNPACKCICTHFQMSQTETWAGQDSWPLGRKETLGRREKKHCISFPTELFLNNFLNHTDQRVNGSQQKCSSLWIPLHSPCVHLDGMVEESSALSRSQWIDFLPKPCSMHAILQCALSTVYEKFSCPGSYLEHLFQL